MNAQSSKVCAEATRCRNISFMFLPIYTDAIRRFQLLKAMNGGRIARSGLDPEQREVSFIATRLRIPGESVRTK
jgi:hypothetical protein